MFSGWKPQNKMWCWMLRIKDFEEATSFRMNGEWQDLGLFWSMIGSVLGLLHFYIFRFTCLRYIFKLISDFQRNIQRKVTETLKIISVAEILFQQLSPGKNGYEPPVAVESTRFLRFLNSVEWWIFQDIVEDPIQWLQLEVWYWIIHPHSVALTRF